MKNIRGATIWVGVGRRYCRLEKCGLFRLRYDWKKQPTKWYSCTAHGKNREYEEGFDANDAAGIAQAIPKCILEAVGKYDREWSGLLRKAYKHHVIAIK